MNLTSTLPAYLYQQYQGDNDVASFFFAFNQLAQQNLDDIIGYQLPIYLNQSGPLLSWAASSIYGIFRPNLSSGGPRPVGPLNTWALNTVPLNTFELINSSANFIADDLTYQRIIQWNTFSGDGYDFTITWLKRRVERFLHGTVFPQDTYDVSVSFTGENTVIIGISNNNLQVTGGAFFGEIGFGDADSVLAEVTTEQTVGRASPMAGALKAAINSGILLLPFQYQYTVLT